MSEQLSGCKFLRLVDPRSVQSFGISAESPVFTSQFIQYQQHCAECQTDYYPLVYAPKSQTISHHFHQSSGGVYFFKMQAMESFNTLSKMETSRSTCIIADLTTCGDVLKEDKESNDKFRKRTYGVNILNITAVCKLCATLKPLDSGLLVSWSYPNLYPICSLEKHQLNLSRGEIKFEFKVNNDGDFQFSPLN